jgi:hypothetical protein
MAPMRLAESTPASEQAATLRLRGITVARSGAAPFSAGGE